MRLHSHLTGDAVKLLRGIVVPTITPLTPDGGLDEPVLRLLLKSILAGGVHGIFAMGTTGEGPALPRAVHRRSVEVTCEAVDGKIPVVARRCRRGTGHRNCTTLLLGSESGRHHSFGRSIANEAALPAYLYNVPYANPPQFHVETIEQLSTLERILGPKDSSGQFGNLTFAIQIFSSRPEYSILVGPERLLSQALQAGADGGVSGGANLLPTLYVQLFDAFQSATKLDARNCSGEFLL